MNSSDAAGPDRLREDQIEAELKKILGPLDDSLGRSGVFYGCLVVAIWPATFLVLWLGLDFRWWAGLLWGLAAVVPVTIIGMSWEKSAIQRAVKTFELRFPKGSSQRDSALTMLSEMECPNKASDKLNEALRPQAAAKPEERIVRRRREAAESQIQRGLEQAAAGSSAGPAPARDDPTPAASPAPPASDSASETVYDYIPLEIATPDVEEQESVESEESVDDFLSFTCPCGAKLKAPSSRKGTRARCAKCKRTLTVPG